MARYRKVDPRIWKDERFLTLNEAEKLVAVYCLTCPQSNRVGIFNFSPAMAAEDLGTSTETFLKRLGNVCRTLRWGFDRVHRVLYFPTWWRYNRPDNPNILQGHLAEFRRTQAAPDAR